MTIKTLPVALSVALLFSLAVAAAATTPAQSSPAPHTKPAPSLPAGKRQAPGAKLPAYKAHNNKGAELLDKGQTAEAIKEFQAALAAKKGYLPARVNLGLAYLQAKKPDAAAAEFNTVLKEKPKTAAARDGLATAYAQQGKYEAAIAEERQVLALEPGNAGAYYNLGCWQAQQRKTTEAFASLDQAVKLGFRDVAWLKADPELKNLQQDKARWAALIAAASRPVDYQHMKVRNVGPPVKVKAKPAGAAKP